MSKPEVIATLGKPTSDDGDLEWKKKALTVGVDFAGEWDKIPAGEIKCVWLSIS